MQKKREYVSISDIPQSVKDAVLSVEDSRFYSHIGVDPKRLTKAMLVNIQSNSAKEGSKYYNSTGYKTFSSYF